MSSFPMAWRTAPRPTDGLRVVNGQIPDTAGEVSTEQRLAAADAAARAVRQELEPAPMAPSQTRYSAPAGAVPRINATRLYQQEGRGHLAGYFNNPLEETGRQAMAQQLFAAPLGGHLRSALQGQELFGRTITNAQARLAEQAAAGVLATGVGAWGLLAAADGLSTPQSSGTMPMA